MSEPDRIGVHLTHCCVLHGCKYGDPNCPVETGMYHTDYICEDCECDMLQNGRDDLPTVDQAYDWWYKLDDDLKIRICNQWKSK